MNRRRFLGYSALGGATAITAPMGCSLTNGSQQTLDQPFELHEATVADLQQAMAEGRHTARSITELYLERIDALDRKGPELRSIIETNPDALSIADELDAERRANGPRGPLHGIPIALKDNIDTHDRMTTTAGSLALEGSIPPRDSFVAEKLRAAGAILLAKAKHERVGVLARDESIQRMERPRWTVSQPLRPRPQPPAAPARAPASPHPQTSQP